MTHYHVYKILPLNPNKSQKNSIHTLTIYCLKICEKKKLKTKFNTIEHYKES